MTLGIALGFAAAALTFTTFMMKSMLPLRAAALARDVPRACWRSASW